MALLDWESNYSVKINKIDEQHKAWISLINYMHEAMKSGKGKDVLGDILDEVVNYTIYHFSSEEKLFDKYNYPEKTQHKKLHDDFVEKFKKIKKDYDNGSSVLTIDVMTSLKEWLTNHILKVDKQYSDFMNIHGIN